MDSNKQVIKNQLKSELKALKLKEFLLREFGGNPQKACLIDMMMSEINATNAVPVRGDGNCLVRAIIVSALKLKKFDVDTFDYEQFREMIASCWAFKGEALYHMDETAIDGLAILMVMKLLRVKKLRVYQCFDGAGKTKGWREYDVSNTGVLDIYDVDVTDVVEIMTVNGCHYTGLTN